MNATRPHRLALPSAISLAVLASGCPDNPGDCDVVPVPDAGVPTYMCSDGRMCGMPNLDQRGDGGVYQICPGTGECALLVHDDGSSEIGFC